MAQGLHGYRKHDAKRLPRRPPWGCCCSRERAHPLLSTPEGEGEELPGQEDQRSQGESQKGREAEVELDRISYVNLVQRHSQGKGAGSRKNHWICV